MSAGDREEILDEARAYITKDRNNSYGEPEDNFQAIANVWNALGVRIAGRDVMPHDVALMMAGMKLARISHNPKHKDSWVDAIGYMACGWDVVKPTMLQAVTELNSPSVVDVNMTGSITSINRKLAESQWDGYWISDKRCTEIGASPHPGHSYGERGSGTVKIEWCDGYVMPATALQSTAQDVEAVKKVADHIKRT